MIVEDERDGKMIAWIESSIEEREMQSRKPVALGRNANADGDDASRSEARSRGTYTFS